LTLLNSAFNDFLTYFVILVFQMILKANSLVVEAGCFYFFLANEPD